MKNKIGSVSYVAVYEDIEFYLITDKSTVSSLKYTLGRCIAQNKNYNSNGEDSVADKITIIPIEEFKGKIKDEIRVFRDENDMSNFFNMNT